MSGRLSLCCVVLRDVRRINQGTGLLDGVEVRLLAAELRPARPAEVRRYGGGCGCGVRCLNGGALSSPMASTTPMDSTS
ncbi:hypothetical protein [Mycolicibacterium fortuitum]|uniref:hypothetical protein n=1 Tax=Mycolicibacterium fortuitum TaxID=1766 RepID=UPI0010557061|nr:hypothetical protein [Mycolicibacterium fortuitum]